MKIQPSRVFENILAGTAMLMEQLQTPPKNETQINRFMKKFVSAAFPDTITPSIPTSIKTYKPREFGVPSLSAIAEYKFATTRRGDSQAMLGRDRLTDSHGYQADGKWHRFYAVLFMTGAFYTPAQIEAHFKQCGFPDSWKAIVLVGNGGKKKGSTQSATPAAPLPHPLHPPCHLTPKCR